MNPLLSVIVTSYNIKDYIGECLDGIINQTLSDIEIIIVDDGSNDGTTDIIRRYAAADSRIRPVLLDNNSPGGVATPANIGLKMAKGEYIGFADGDDVYDPTMFEKLYLSAKRYDSDIAICSFMEFDTDTRARTSAHDYSWQTVCASRSIELESAHDKVDILRLLPVPWRKIYRRRLIEDNSIAFHECAHFFEDNYFHWLVTIAARRVSIIDEVLCFHRRNRVGQTMLSGGEKLLGVFYQHELIMAFIADRDDGNLYSKEAARWLVGHVSWVSQTLSRQYAREFYNSARAELLRHKKSNIRLFCSGQECDRQTVELLVWMLGSRPDLFEEALNGKYDRSFLRRAYFNSIRLGFCGFCKASLKYIFSLLRRSLLEKKSHRDEQLNAIIQLIQESDRNIHNLHTRLNDVERVVEIGLINIAENNAVALKRNQ